MAVSNKMFTLDINNVHASNTNHTLTADEVKKYTGFAVEVDTVVSFNGGAQEFPISKGFPMPIPGNVTTIQLGAASRLYLGV